jgi:hypothetical protein
LKRGLLTEAEEQLVIDLHARLGNRLNLSPCYIHIYMLVTNLHQSILFKYFGCFINGVWVVVFMDMVFC